MRRPTRFQLNQCCCKPGRWADGECSRVRNLHQYPNARIKVPKDKEDALLWLTKYLGWSKPDAQVALGEAPRERQQLSRGCNDGARKDMFVWAGHFYQEDLEYNGGEQRVRVSLRAEGSAHAERRGKPCLPMRELAGRDGVQNDLLPQALAQGASAGAISSSTRSKSPLLLGARALPMKSPAGAVAGAGAGRGAAAARSPAAAATQMLSPSEIALGVRKTPAPKKKEEPPKGQSPAKSSPAKRRADASWSAKNDARRADPKDLYARGNFVGTFTSLVTLLDVTEAHAQSDCEGSLFCRKEEMSQHGLCGTMSVRCSRRAGCCGAGAEQTDGLVHRWASSPVNSKSDSESYTVNDLGNMAAGLLGSMEKAAEVFTTMMLKPPPASKGNRFIYDKLAPAVKKLCDESCDKVRTRACACGGMGPGGVCAEAA